MLRRMSFILLSLLFPLLILTAVWAQDDKPDITRSTGYPVNIPPTPNSLYGSHSNIANT